MTPTEQDKELREKISHRFDSVCAEGHQQSCGEYQTAVDDVMQLITADRKRVALEARIDEIRMIETAQQNTDQWGGFCIDDTSDFLNYIDGRIDELKSQQQEKR